MNVALEKIVAYLDALLLTNEIHDSAHAMNGLQVENGRTVSKIALAVDGSLYDVPGGESRGGHAHYQVQQLIVAASDSFDVVIDDGNIKRTFTLNHPYQGLLVVHGLWRELQNFSSGSVCLVLASEKYEEADYMRSYDKFLEYKK